MKLRREFSGPVSADDAAARASKLLRSMKYREIQNPNHLQFTRGSKAASVFGLRPRSFLSTIHIWIEGHGEDSKVTVEQEIAQVVQPPHRLVKLLVEGEMDDLQRGILTNQPSVVNRVRQNRMAGNCHLSYLLLCVGISFGIARIVGPQTTFEGASAWVVSYFGLIYFSYLMPFPLLEFPVHHPKGAKVIPDPEPEEAPTAEKRSKATSDA